MKIAAFLFLVDILSHISWFLQLVAVISGIFIVLIVIFIVRPQMSQKEEG